MDIHEESALDVLRSEATEAVAHVLAWCCILQGVLVHVLDFVEDDAGWLVDSVESDYGSQDGRDEHNVVVACWQPEDIIILHTLRRIVDVRLELGALLLGGGSLHERSLLSDWNWSIGHLCHAWRRRRARSVSSLRHGECRYLVVKSWCSVSVDR